MERVNYEEFMKEYAALKKQYGKMITNIVPGTMAQSGEYDILKRDGGMIATVCEPYRVKGYFAAKSKEDLQKLLTGLSPDIIFEWLHQGDDNLEDVMRRAGIAHYATYIRRMRVYKKNPYEIPAQGKMALLQKLYDPDCGEYATEKDAESLWELSNSVFDPYCDDIFTLEKWREIIDRKEVLIYRAKGKILSCYVWRLEGSKLYGNISINKTSADILYNLERKVFEKMWDRGIRVFYSWKNIKNEKAIRREMHVDREIMERESVLYDSIYKS